MMVRHGCGLEHDTPQQMSSATDTFSTQCTAVMGNFMPSATGNRRETCQSRCLFGGYLAKPGYFCDQHRAGDRPNPGHGPQDLDGFGPCHIASDQAFDLIFQFDHLSIKNEAARCVHVLE